MLVLLRRAAADRRRAAPDSGVCVGHVHALERPHHAVFPFGGWHARAIGQREFDVLEDGQVADEIEALEDEADLLVADARAVGEVQVRYLFAVSVY